MPQRHEPLSLKISCSKTIINNFDKISYNCDSTSKMVSMLDNDSYLQIRGPFEDLPASVLLDLTTADRDIKFLGKKHLHHLILPQITNISFGFVRDPLHCLKFLKERCKNLRHLDFSYQHALGPPALISIIPYIPNIVTLNLNFTDAIDQVMGLIGDHCPGIKVLDIRNTTITENGLKLLCYDEETSTIRCKLLHKLLLQGCSISAYPVAFLLQMIPTIQELDFPKMVEVFAVLANEGVTMGDDGDFIPLLLNNFISQRESYLPIELLEFGIKLCPNITKISVDNSPMPNSLLCQLSVLPHLTHLSISNTEDFSMDFNEGVVPILLARGQIIKSIMLTRFTQIDITVIGELCPRLENLALSDIIEYEPVFYPRSDLFIRLTALEIWSATGTDSLTQNVIQQLMSFCPELQNLLLCSIPAVNDTLLTNIWEINPMTKLTRLTLNKCFNISPYTLHILLDTTNNLNFIRIWGCSRIQENHYKELQARIKKENCDLYLDWFPMELQYDI